MDDSLGQLDELDRFCIDRIDEAVTLEEGNGWLHINLARVALAPQVELDHGNGQELRVATRVDGHWHLGFLLVCSSEVLKTFRWLPHSVDGDVLYN